MCSTSSWFLKLITFLLASIYWKYLETVVQNILSRAFIASLKNPRKNDEKDDLNKTCGLFYGLIFSDYFWDLCCDVLVHGVKWLLDTDVFVVTSSQRRDVFRSCIQMMIDLGWSVWCISEWLNLFWWDENIVCIFNYSICPWIISYLTIWPTLWKASACDGFFETHEYFMIK